MSRLGVYEDPESEGLGPGGEVGFSPARLEAAVRLYGAHVQGVQFQANRREMLPACGPFPCQIRATE